MARDDGVVGVGPPWTGPRPGARRLGLVDGDDRAADVPRVEVATADVGEIGGPHDAHSQLGGPGDSAVEVVDLEDRHVPAIATALVQQPPGRRAVGGRADDLEELIADRHQRVVQPEHRNAWILEAHGQPEERAQVGDDLITVGGHECDLTKADHGRTVVGVVGGRDAGSAAVP